MRLQTSLLRCVNPTAGASEEKLMSLVVLANFAPFWALPDFRDGTRPQCSHRSCRVDGFRYTTTLLPKDLLFQKRAHS